MSREHPDLAPVDLKSIGDGLPRSDLDTIERIAQLRLTDKQKRFCEQYVRDFNSERAYHEAGFLTASKFAQSNLRGLMENPRVLEYIKILKTEIARRIDLRLDDILNEYKIIAFSNIDNFVEWGEESGVRFKFKDLDELAPEQRRAIQEFSVTMNKDGTYRIKLRLYDKKTAMDKLLEYMKELKPKKPSKLPGINITNIRVMLGDPKVRRAIELISNRMFTTNVKLSPHQEAALSTVSPDDTDTEAEPNGRYDF